MVSRVDRLGLAVGASLALHLGALWGLKEPKEAVPSQQEPFEFELVATAEASSSGRALPEAHARAATRPAILQPGGRSTQNIDRIARGGGKGVGALQVTWLVSSSSSIRLHTSAQTVWVDPQMSRLNTSRAHVSRERRRATPNPAEDVFVATGTGTYRARALPRPRAEASGAPGFREPQDAQPISGAESLTAPIPVAGAERWSSSSKNGSNTETEPAPQGAGGPATASLPGGIRHGRGRDRFGARVAMGRAAVDRGPAATQAQDLDQRVRDRVNAELRVDRASESWIDASPRLARRAGPDTGGIEALGRPGSGRGQSQGGSATPRRVGPGRANQLDTSDERYVRWYLRVRQRIIRGLAFPRARALARDQGFSVYRFRVGPSGELIGAPSLERTSGFEDFDEAAERAIQQAAPFPPIPAALLPDDLGTHSIRIRIQHFNPMVR